MNKYQEVWCFGFNPGNDAGVDANITQANALLLSDAELATWMNSSSKGAQASRSVSGSFAPPLGKSLKQVRSIA